MRSPLILFASAALVSAGNVSGEKCKTVGVDYQTKNNLALNSYKGRWYEIQRDASTGYEWSSTCVTATYDYVDSNNSIIQVNNRGWFWWWFFSYYKLAGKAKCWTEGKCRVSFSWFNLNWGL